MSNKSTGSKVASQAGKTLGSSRSSGLQKSLAGSALAQSGTNKVTSAAIEKKASSALQNSSSTTTKALAGSLVSQSKK